MNKINWSLAITAEQKAGQTRSDLQRIYSSIAQAMMDAKARERHYDGIQSAISYRGDGNPEFSAESDALFAWRSSVWTYAAIALNDVMTGSRGIPTEEEFLSELAAACPFDWPQ